VDGRQGTPLSRKRGSLLFVALVTLPASIAVASSAAFAADRALHLTWRAPGECPSGAEVEAQIEGIFNGRAPTSASKRLDAVSTIVRTASDVWTVRLETDLNGVYGERILQGETCQAVSSAAALILAMALDPEAVGRALAARPPRDTTPTPGGGASTTVVAVAEVGPAHEPWRPEAAALAVVVFAVLPRPAAAAGLILGVKHRGLDIELTGLLSEEVRAQAMNHGGAGGSFRLLSAGARLCSDVWQHLWVVGFCAGGRVDRIDATGFGVTNPGSGRVTTFAGLGTLSISVPLTRHLFAGLEAGLEGRLYRPRFVLGGVGVVYETPSLSASSGASLRVVF
jgi:hypothetical protein